MSYGRRQKLDVRITGLLLIGTGLTDEKLKAEVARFACVLASAYIEVACKEILEEHANARADPGVRRYVASQLHFFQNASVEKILQLAGHFDPVRRATLEEKVSDRVKDSVGSINGNRNNIAHGDDSGITLGSLKTYYTDAKQLMKELEALFPPKKK